MQWLTPDNGGQFLANLYNLWEPGTYVDGLPPYSYTGNPLAMPAERGVEYWEGEPFPCAILGLSWCNVGVQPFRQHLHPEVTFTIQSLL